MGEHVVTIGRDESVWWAVCSCGFRGLPVNRLWKAETEASVHQRLNEIRAEIRTARAAPLSPEEPDHA